MSSRSRDRIFAYMWKESLQVVRDPSSILIAIILPLIMMFLFGYGVSLDTNTVKIGLVLEDSSADARSLAHAFSQTKFFDVQQSQDRHFLEDEMVAGRLRGVVVIPQDFSDKFARGQQVQVQVLADGSETNTASFVQNYAQGVVNTWLQSRQYDTGAAVTLPFALEPRVWFNAELKSRNVLLPGSISVVMSMIGCLLTALVVAREWERGTMEAMMSTPIRVHEMIIAKLTPYFLLGLFSMALCVGISIFIFGVPFRGSFLALLLATSAFLLAALGQGMLISTAAKSQFIASQIALLTGFLPAFLLSGFLFEINSMPLPLRLLTYALPPRYFVAILQTIFAAGDIWSLFIPNLLTMLLLATILLGLTAKRSVKRLA